MNFEKVYLSFGCNTGWFSRCEPHLRLTKASRVASSFSLPCVPLQLEDANSSFENLMAKIFRAALWRSFVVCKSDDTADRLVGVNILNDCGSAVVRVLIGGVDLCTAAP